MKNITITFLLSFFCGCNLHPAFEATYYEQVTKIKFPAEYTVVATADNGEYLTIAILDIDTAMCKSFVKTNNFKSIGETFHATLLGLNLLDSAYQKLPDSKRCLIKEVGKIPGKVGWAYLVDTVKCRIYCEIDYPDAGGD